MIKKLSFDVHLKSLCKKAGQKHCTCQIKLLQINSVIKLQSSYCPLIWMLCLSSLKNSLNHIHEGALMLIYDDHAHAFPDILEMTNKKTVHQKKQLRMTGKGNLQISAWLISTNIEIYLHRVNIYNLRNFQSLYSTCKKNARFETEIVTYQGP